MSQDSAETLRGESQWLKTAGDGTSYPIDDVEAFELRPDGSLFQNPSTIQPSYKEGSTIDWFWEEGTEREHKRALHSLRGIRKLLAPILESSWTWIVIILVGVGIGVVGAWLDILVKWLGDLREGRCTHGFLYNQVACCSGLDPGDICTEWATWSEYYNVKSILGQSILQLTFYIVLAIAFAGSAAVLVTHYAPYAFHTGIPEIKAILSGFVFDRFLGAWTLLIKALGLALAVASGLSLGKEGPLVHVACCMAYLLSRLLRLKQSEAQKRKLLAAAASAGVSVAFGSPLGGVLFGLEELDTFSFSNESDVMWRGFVASVIAAMALQYVDPFGTAKLVLFQVSGVSATWKAFELIPWMFLAILGGVFGSLLIKLNAAVAVYRHRSFLRDYPIAEVIGFTAITAAVSYLVVFLRVQSSELVANLFQECDPARGDYHGLCNPTAVWENIFLLILTALVKIIFTSWTFGMMIPAGIFLPTIAIGACLGRAVGLLTEGLQRTYPKALIFNSCPPDATVRCISPGFYAVIGASAMLGGVTRMTISLVVILFELTGALSHVLPIMISVMVSKWIGDAFGKDGIYAVWIALRQYPWLPPSDFRDNGQSASQIIKSVDNLVVIQDEREFTLQELDQFVTSSTFHGYPVVRGEQLLGYVAGDKITAYIAPLLADDRISQTPRRCTFSKEAAASNSDLINLSVLLDEAVLQLRKEIPLEVVVQMFQKMNLRHILFSHGGKLTGLVTKTDIVWLLTAHLPHTAALSNEER
ncbi:Chloride channel [Abortiporus biennis]